MRKLNEGLVKNDLEHVLINNIHFDEYDSKMGKDADVITMSFRLKMREAAVDLMSFLESGYEWILDADVGSGETWNGDTIVFAEMRRMPSTAYSIMEMLHDLKELSGIDIGDWDFKWYKDTDYQELTSENLKATIPFKPDAYLDAIDRYTTVEETINDVKSKIVNLKKMNGIQSV